MTAESKAQIKSYFQTSDRPTEGQFADLIDSYQDINSTLTILASSSPGTVGLQLLAAVTTAQASNIIGVPTGGTVGLQIFQTNTTAQAAAILNLGTISTQAANNVAITGGSLTTVTVTSAAVVSPNFTGQPSGLITSGTYTPTLFNVTNIQSSTAYVLTYLRVGNMVTVCGKVDIDPTSSSTGTELGISLPIASDFTAPEQCGGAGGPLDFNQAAGIAADTTNNRASMQFIAQTNALLAIYFNFSYRIL